MVDDFTFINQNKEINISVHTVRERERVLGILFLIKFFISSLVYKRYNIYLNIINLHKKTCLEGLFCIQWHTSLNTMLKRCFRNCIPFKSNFRNKNGILNTSKTLETSFFNNSRSLGQILLTLKIISNNNRTQVIFI